MIPVGTKSNGWEILRMAVSCFCNDIVQVGVNRVAEIEMGNASWEDQISGGRWARAVVSEYQCANGDWSHIGWAVAVAIAKLCDAYGKRDVHHQYNLIAVPRKGTSANFHSSKSNGWIDDESHN